MLAWSGLTALGQAQLPPGCAPYPNNCLYSPTAAVAIGGTAANVSYRDALGLTRTLEVYVRVPVGVQGALPVVVWSPDGEGATDSRAVMTAWSEATARAGYLTVSVAHTPRTDVEKARFCAAAAVEEDFCDFLNPVMWDGPNDLQRVLDWLEEVNESGPVEVRGRIDIKRVALAGQGHGSNSAISLLGARRLFSTARTAAPSDFSDPRPLAVVALSPQGPTQAGFFDTDIGRPVTSFTPVERPVLSVTGAGDNDCYLPSTCFAGDTPARRRVVFDLLARGGKYEMFVKSVEMSHELVDSLDTAACAAQGVAPANCANFANWLRAAVLAFLDAQVRGLAPARAWLQNDLIQPASANGVIWRKK